MTEEDKAKEEETSQEPTKKKRPTTPIIIALAVVIGLILVYQVATRLLGSAGQKLTEQVVEQAIEQTAEGEVDVDISDEGGQVTIETEEGTFTAGQRELPENFPSDMPVYPGATIITTASTADAATVSFTTEDSLADATGYYKDELTDKGWQVTQTATLDNATVYGIEKGEVSGAVAITETEEGTSIVISLDFEAE